MPLLFFAHVRNFFVDLFVPISSTSISTSISPTVAPSPSSICLLDLPSPLQTFATVASQALSSLSEKSVSYLQTLSSHLLSAVQDFVRKATVSSTEHPTPPSYLPYLRDLVYSPTTAYPATLLAVVLIILAMSYGSRSGWGGGRIPSPFGGFGGSGAPRVTDRDFSYVTSDDIDYPPRVYDPRDAYYQPRPPPVDDGPDVILLRHKSVTYPLEFPAYSISDGALTVGEIRNKAARELGAKDPRRIKLLYKGRNLKDDMLSARSEGLKQESEIMCVVSEGIPNGYGSSDSDPENRFDARPRAERRPSTRRQRRTASADPAPTQSAPNLAPPGMERGHSSGASRPNSPVPAPNSPLDQLDQLASTFRTKLVPQCIVYTSNPPADPKARDFEHKKLSETILVQIILKLDEVATGPDEQARQRRRELVKEAQAMLAKLDEAARQA